MAQMVVLTMPRALECCERVRAVLDHTPEIQDTTSIDPKEPDGKNREVITVQILFVF